MNVAIFETEHFEAVYPLIRLFDSPGNQLFLYVYPDTAQQLQQMSAIPGTAKWIIKKDDETKREFISRMRKDMSSYKVDLLWLATVSDNYYQYAQLISAVRPGQTIITAHSVNQLFDTKKLWMPRRLFRAVGKAMLLGRINGINVLSTTLLPALQERMQGKLKTYSISGGIAENLQEKRINLNENDEVRIVVPGTVDTRRRDYREVVTIAQLMDRARIKARFIIAGKIEGEFGEDLLEKLTIWDQYFQFTKFEWNVEGLTQSVFEDTLNSSHFIFSPQTKAIVVDDDVMEQYGKTICSGNIGDMINSGKPIILPQYVNTDPAMSGAVIKYDSVESFLKVIEKYLTTESYELLTAGAIESLAAYSLKSVIESYPDLFK